MESAIPATGKLIEQQISTRLFRGPYPRMLFIPLNDQWRESAKDFLPSEALLLGVDISVNEIQFSFRCTEQAWEEWKASGKLKNHRIIYQGSRRFLREAGS